MNMSSFPRLAAAMLLLLATSTDARDRQASSEYEIPPHGVVGITDAHLGPESWVAMLPSPDALILDAEAIRAQNTRLVAVDDSMHDLAAMPAILGAERVRGWIEGLASAPSRALYDGKGALIAPSVLEQALDNRNLGAIPASQPTRFGMVIRRASLRTFPDALRAYSTSDDSDIDRFQESALFPGTPVVVAHQSSDGQWLFVASLNYAAWIEADAVAIGGRDPVLAYGKKTPYRVITGNKVQTVFTPEVPAVSELLLDMGSRLPLSADALAASINGQHPYTSWIIDLPVRGEDGALSFSPALLQKIAGSAADYLPLTRANIIRQSFKFLGERYGWGHSYNGRDCSGFVSEVYRSMGVILPRNTSDQSVSPGLNRTHLAATATREERLAAVAAMDVGDLVYIPGHVMMMIGRIDGRPYVIHDTNGGSILGKDGKLASMRLNAVSVTPLEPLMFNATETYIDRMTNIVRIRP